MPEKIAGFDPSTTNIALTTVYPMGRDGGVQTVVRDLAIEYKHLGFNVDTYSASNELVGIKSGDAKPLGISIPLRMFGTTGSGVALPDLKVHSEVLNATIMHGHESALNAQELLLYSARRMHPNFKNMLNIGTMHAFNKYGSMYLATFAGLGKLFDKLQVMDAVTVVSEPSKKSNEKAFPFVENVTFEVVPNACNTEVFNPEGKGIEKYRDGKLNILYVGRLEERKGVHLALEAISILAKTHDSFRFIIGGDGPWKDKLAAQAKDLGIDKITEFIGRVPQEDLPALYRTCHIGLFLSTKNESFGIVPLEAMASGLAVVIANNEGYSTLHEESESGPNSLLVDPADVVNTANQISSLMGEENISLRKKIGKNARTFSLKFSTGSIARQYLDVYSNAWDRKHRK